MDFTGSVSGIKYKLRSRGLALWKALQQLKLNVLHLLTECESCSLAGGSVLIHSPLHSEIFPMCVISFAAAVSLIVSNFSSSVLNTVCIYEREFTSTSEGDLEFLNDLLISLLQ